MALEVKGMTRSFKFKKGTEYVTLADPGTDFTPDMVMNYYSNMYPELTTATVHGPLIKSRKIWLSTSSRQPSEQKDDGYGKEK